MPLFWIGPVCKVSGFGMVSYFNLSYRAGIIIYDQLDFGTNLCAVGM